VTVALASLLWCNRPPAHEPSNIAPTRPMTLASTGSGGATPPSSVAASQERRYLKRIPVPSDSEWRVAVLGERELTLLTLETARVLTITDLVTNGERTTFTLHSQSKVVGCTIERSGDHGRAAFECPSELAAVVIELDPSLDRDEIKHIEREIQTLLPPSDACDRAERCCKAAWPLLVPGESCDVNFALGVDRFPDTCMKSLAGLRLLFASKPPPAECE